MNDETERAKKIDAAYMEGFAEYEQGRPASANPYRASKDNERNLAWNKGWLDCPHKYGNSL